MGAVAHSGKPRRQFSFPPHKACSSVGSLAQSAPTCEPSLAAMSAALRCSAKCCAGGAWQRAAAVSLTCGKRNYCSWRGRRTGSLPASKRASAAAAGSGLNNGSLNQEPGRTCEQELEQASSVSGLACVSAMRVAPPATPVTAREMLPRQASSRKAPGSSGEASSSARPEGR